MLHRGPLREDIIKIPIGTAMDDIEREVILRTLAANAGNKTATAEVLGISRRSIYNKLALYGVATGDEDDERRQPSSSLSRRRGATPVTDVAITPTYTALRVCNVCARETRSCVETLQAARSAGRWVARRRSSAASTAARNCARSIGLAKKGTPSSPAISAPRG